MPLAIVDNHNLTRAQLIDKLEAYEKALVLIDDAAYKFYLEHRVEMLDTWAAKALGEARDKMFEAEGE